MFIFENVVKAVVLKLIAAFLFAMMSTLLRYVGTRYPVGQVVFFRSAFAILPVVIIYAWRGELEAAIRMGRPLGHFGRGLTAQNLGHTIINRVGIHHSRFALHLSAATLLTGLPSYRLYDFSRGDRHQLAGTPSM